MHFFSQLAHKWLKSILMWTISALDWREGRHQPAPTSLFIFRNIMHVWCNAGLHSEDGIYLSLFAHSLAIVLFYIPRPFAPSLLKSSYPATAILLLILLLHSLASFSLTPLHSVHNGISVWWNLLREDVLGWLGLWLPDEVTGSPFWWNYTRLCPLRDWTCTFGC